MACFILEAERTAITLKIFTLPDLSDSLLLWPLPHLLLPGFSLPISL